MKNTPKSYHEHFARFFEQPTRESLRELLKNNVGEFRQCDFKAQLPEWSSLAKHILAMANSGGGAIIVGVSEQDDGSLEPKGVDKIEDKAVITNGIKGFLPESLLGKIDLVDFRYDSSDFAKLAGKKFQTIFIGYEDTDLPYVTAKAGVSIRANAIYIRRDGSSDEASNDELQKLINKRLETGQSTTQQLDLKEEIGQLKTLFEFIPASYSSPTFAVNIAKFLQGAITTSPNPNYPSEGFEKFISRMIERKKLRIQKKLGL